MDDGCGFRMEGESERVKRDYRSVAEEESEPVIIQTIPH